MLIGIAWITCMVVLAFLTYIGMMCHKTMYAFFMEFPLTSGVLQHDIGNSWWIMPFYYTMILLVAIAVTYRCYQEVVATTTYYPELRTI